MVGEKLHDALDAVWRVIEKAHDLAETLRAHRLFPKRKIFAGLVTTAIGYAIQGVLKLTGVDLGPILGPEIPLAAGWVTAYFFTDGARVKMLDEVDHTAIDTEERVDRERRARDVAERT